MMTGFSACSWAVRPEGKHSIIFCGVQEGDDVFFRGEHNPGLK